MSDIVERLARLAFLEHGETSAGLRESLDEIERLRAELAYQTDMACQQTVALRARVAELEKRDALRDAVIAAYQQGAMDVHQNYQPDRAPDFTEAAYDYADAALAQQEGEG